MPMRNLSLSLYSTWLDLPLGSEAAHRCLAEGGWSICRSTVTTD
jgi:hypothetical protein